jgi:hypothetical protein
MMIANWMQDSVMSQVVNPRLSTIPDFTSRERKVSRSDPARYAKKRDREVPYGMKGGEH